MDLQYIKLSIFIILLYVMIASACDLNDEDSEGQCRSKRQVLSNLQEFCKDMWTAAAGIACPDVVDMTFLDDIPASRGLSGGFRRKRQTEVPPEKCEMLWLHVAMMVCPGYPVENLIPLPDGFWDGSPTPPER